MKKFILYTFGTLGLLIALNIAGYACSCIRRGDEPVKQQVERSKKEAYAVFSGKVLEVREAENADVIVKLRVKTLWKGNLSKEVKIRTGSNSAMCGYNFEVGESYLIYAYGTGKNDINTNICTRTANFSSAAADVKILGKGKKPKR